MAHGERASRKANRAGREYWSPRLPRAGGWGSSWKLRTRRRERQLAKDELRREAVASQPIHDFACRPYA